MTASDAHRALGATITRLADHQRTAEAQTYQQAMQLRHLRPTQAEVLQAMVARHTRRWNRRLYLGMVAILLAIITVNIGAAAVHNHIAASLNP